MRTPVISIGTLKKRIGYICAIPHKPEHKMIAVTASPTSVSGMPATKKRSDRNDR